MSNRPSLESLSYYSPTFLKSCVGLKKSTKLSYISKTILEASSNLLISLTNVSSCRLIRMIGKTGIKCLSKSPSLALCLAILSKILNILFCVLYTKKASWSSTTAMAPLLSTAGGFSCTTFSRHLMHASDSSINPTLCCITVVIPLTRPAFTRLLTSEGKMSMSVVKLYTAKYLTSSPKSDIISLFTILTKISMNCSVMNPCI